MSGLVERIVRGNHLSRTRFHDEKGNRVPLASLAYLPLAAASCLSRVLFNRRPLRPTLSYQATHLIAQHLPPDCHAVEFGSGMSTAWLAERVGSLLSIEDDPAWAQRVRAILDARGIGNVRHQLRTSDTYVDLDGIPDEHFHFALIDGSERAGCVRAVLPKMRPGSLIYLDNSDKDMAIPDGDVRIAEKLLTEAAAAKNWRVRYFTDFSPTNVFAEQGMMVNVT